MNPCIQTAISRPQPDLARSLAECGVATVHEAQNKPGILDISLRPIQEGYSISGPAVTCLNHPGDNLMVRAAFDVCQPGNVPVVTTATS